jgi:hypothetical protein
MRRRYEAVKFNTIDAVAAHRVERPEWSFCAASLVLGGLAVFPLEDYFKS